MKRSPVVGVVLCGSLAFASVAAAQGAMRRAAKAPFDDKVGVAITLQAGADSYRFTGRASCKHEPKGYIYMVPARLWSIEQHEGTHSVHLTFWRPASGASDMFTLHFQAGDKTYEADTVKTPYGGSPKGSGGVRFTAAGAGGEFTVNATAANGMRISGTIKCDAFGAIVAEGGD